MNLEKIRSVYNWKKIIQDYEQLMLELLQKRNWGFYLSAPRIKLLENIGECKDPDDIFCDVCDKASDELENKHEEKKPKPVIVGPYLRLNEKEKFD